MLTENKYQKMLWWQHLQSIQNSVMMIEKEEQRAREYIQNTALTLKIHHRDHIIRDSFLFAELDEVRNLQACLFPIYNKGNVIKIEINSSLPVSFMESPK